MALLIKGRQRGLCYWLFTLRSRPHWKAGSQSEEPAAEALWTTLYSLLPLSTAQLSPHKGKSMSVGHGFSPSCVTSSLQAAQERRALWFWPSPHEGKWPSVELAISFSHITQGLWTTGKGRASRLAISPQEVLARHGAAPHSHTCCLPSHWVGGLVGREVLQYSLKACALGNHLVRLYGYARPGHGGVLGFWGGVGQILGKIFIFKQKKSFKIMHVWESDWQTSSRQRVTGKLPS